MVISLAIATLKQLEAVTTFLEGNDTSVSLPAGYRKSLIYAVLPFAFDKLRGKVRRGYLEGGAIWNFLLVSVVAAITMRKRGLFGSFRYL